MKKGDIVSSEKREMKDSTMHVSRALTHLRTNEGSDYIATIVYSDFLSDSQGLG